ncbi:conserved protein of unknown function [Petrocella atlantisensis]|uniref:Type 4 fimbrial biogenesis protein PilX N-terminal domain-containing protein n=1 Tax=Petrocella atlantisensis TaxID=2173034 RepID=A0A3P7NWL7_9FIRM|nr:hypothetical protein [Petrocella atlantisensis]VDN47604.1 conserved protein of unknown function [Petrocella atlantisensis]
MKNKSRHLMDVVEAGDGMKLNRIIRHLKINEQGAALAYVVVVMTVVFLLMGTMITLSMGENDQAMYQTDYMKAYYIARAGAESMAMEMERMDNSAYEQFLDEQVAEAGGVLDGEGDLEVSVEKDGDEYRVSSLGTYKNTQAKVNIIMSYRDRTELDFGVYAKEDMEDLQVKDFTGQLASGGSIDFKTQSDENEVGEANIMPYTTNNVSITVPRLNGFSIANEIDLDIDDNYDITASATITQWDMKNNKTLTIDTDMAEYRKGSVEDYEDTFRILSAGSSSEKWMVLLVQGEAIMNGDIEVTGNHNLMIIVEDAFYLGGALRMDNDNRVEFYIMDESNSSTSGNNIFKDEGQYYDLIIAGSNVIGDEGTDKNPSLLNFFIHGSDTFSNNVLMDTNAKFCGYVIGPEAYVKIKNGNTDIYGGIYAREVDLDASISYTQPNPSTDTYTLYKQMSIDYWE